MFSGEKVCQKIGASIPRIVLYHQTKQIFLPSSNSRMTCPGCQANPSCQIPVPGSQGRPTLSRTHLLLHSTPFLYDSHPLSSRYNFSFFKLQQSAAWLKFCLGFVCVFVFSPLLDFSPSSSTLPALYFVVRS